jgi:hypothetical protein
MKIPSRLVDLFGIPKDLLTPIPFTALAEIEQSISRKVAAFDFASLAQKAIADGIDRAKGPRVVQNRNTKTRKNENTKKTKGIRGPSV